MIIALRQKMRRRKLKNEVLIGACIIRCLQQLVVLAIDMQRFGHLDRKRFVTNARTRFESNWIEAEGMSTGAKNAKSFLFEGSPRSAHVDFLQIDCPKSTFPLRISLGGSDENGSRRSLPSLRSQFNEKGNVAQGRSFEILVGQKSFVGCS